MYLNKNAIFILFLLTIIIFFSGCINPGGRVGYTVFITPSERSEATLIVPVVIDNKSGEVDQIMSTFPTSTKGNPIFEIIQTEKGPALKITTHETTEIWLSKHYKLSGDELMDTKILSMTEFSYDRNGNPMMKSWVHINSTSGQIPVFLVSFDAGAEKSRVLTVGERNLSNGWHQIDVEGGIALAE